MSRTIVFPFGSKKNSEYVVDVSPAYSSSRRTTIIKGATKCCSADVGQKRFCKECKKDTPYNADMKKFSFLDKEYVVPAEQVDNALSGMEKTDIVVKAVLELEPAVARDLYAGLKFITPNADAVGDYVELSALLGSRVAVVEFVDRQIQHQALLSVNNDGVIQLRLLQEGEALRKPVVDVGCVEANPEVVRLKQKILANIIDNDYDLCLFRDMRNELEEQFLEGLISGKGVDVVSSEVVASSQADELAELKALAGGD